MSQSSPHSSPVFGEHESGSSEDHDDLQTALALGRRAVDGISLAGQAAGALGRLGARSISRAMNDHPAATVGAAVGVGFVLGGGLRTAVGRVARTMVLRSVAAMALSHAAEILQDAESYPTSQEH